MRSRRDRRKTNENSRSGPLRTRLLRGCCCCVCAFRVCWIAVASPSFAPQIAASQSAAAGSAPLVGRLDFHCHGLRVHPRDARPYSWASALRFASRLEQGDEDFRTRPLCIRHLRGRCCAFRLRRIAVAIIPIFLKEQSLMMASSSVRNALVVCAIAITLAGCSSSAQSGFAPSGVTPTALTMQAAHARPSMLYRPWPLAPIPIKGSLPLASPPVAGHMDSSAQFRQTTTTARLPTT